LSFVFECGLEEIVLERLWKGFVYSRDSNFSNVIPLFRQILESCSRHPNDEKYQRIADLTSIVF
jgi:hypothetical protein